MTEQEEKELQENIKTTYAVIKKDQTGKRFGMLVAQYPLRKNGRIYYHCICDCGNEKDIRADALAGNISHSCGCQVQKRIDLTGQRFGKLVVLEMLPNDKCKCLCDCGTITTVLGHNLKRKNTESCGCFYNRSKGESKILELLQTNAIPYQKEISFSGLKGKGGGTVRYDFGVYTENLETLLYLIEFDGEQHILLNGYSGPNLEENDKIKNAYCKENNIPLIRIPYTHLKELKIEDLILETSKFII